MKKKLKGLYEKGIISHPEMERFKFLEMYGCELHVEESNPSASQVKYEISAIFKVTRIGDSV